MTRTPILIDCDPGQDDAVMLMLAVASPELELLAVTTVGGNVPLVHTAANARRILELMGRRDVPVAAGCDRPMTRALVTAGHVHGETGLRGLDLPPPTLALDERHGVEVIIETIRARDGVVLCPVGPLTNVATAFARAPDLARRVERIVLMGGAIHGGNVTPVAEYNIYADPEAAALVFGSGAKLTMIGLDCTHQALLGAAEIAALRRAGSKAALATAALFDFPERWKPEYYGGRVGFPVHDACVIGYLVAPRLFRGRDCHVAIETHSELTLGQTVVDWHGRHGRPANAHVVRDVDAPAFLALLLQRLGRG